MKRTVRFILVVVLAAALSQIAFAQQGPGPGGGQGWAAKSATPEQFKEKKDRILKFIEDRRAKLDQAKACVEAATTDEELAKCRPERPAGMGPGMGPGMRRGGRMQQPPTPPAQDQ